uniref:MADF domain-containing protein n=1 Tax=Stomoxys calcitrans TaxID=35570 RepID=A0A1I8P7X7_STOCA
MDSDALQGKLQQWSCDEDKVEIGEMFTAQWHAQSSAATSAIGSVLRSDPSSALPRIDYSATAVSTASAISSEIQPAVSLNEINPNATETDLEVDRWPVSQIMRLLRFYAAHRCLWDVDCADNHNRKMRHAALVDITAAMGDDMTKEQIVQKINVVRATYRYERKRIKQRIKRGMGAKTKLKWFALADAFLRKVPKKGRKAEDPQNSDSDLEDAVIFTINPETLGPLLKKDATQEIKNREEIKEFRSYIHSESADCDAIPKTEKERDGDTNFSIGVISSETFENPNSEDIENNLQKQLNTLNKSPLCSKDHYDLARLLKQEPNLETKIWTLETTIQFLHLMKSHPILLGDNMGHIEESHKLALQTIANEMARSYKSIEKRWLIFKKTVEEEKQKILNNPIYVPRYKWWQEAATIMQSLPQLKTESIYLEEKSESENDEGEYASRFENPIPSVAPLSNMNEAMASLFHDDFSLSSNSNSEQTLVNDASNSSKIVWKGLEDDLLEGKWSLKHSVKFLRLYGVHRCLWDLNDPDYRSRPLRNAAIEDIAASMGHNLTPSYVAKKIKIFRITYMQQRKRILEATQRGETQEILLKWFPLADSFLRPHIGLRSIKSDAKEIPQFDFQYVYANLNLIDPALLNDFRGKGTQNAIDIGDNEDERINSPAEK